jgi:hypothetical protein
MKTRETVIQNKIDELLAVLDKDIDQLSESLSRLNELRTATIKRNDSLLGKLLEDVQTKSESYKNQTSKRQKLIRDLASALGCHFEELTLSKLEGFLRGEQKDLLTERKDKLRSVTKKLKNEHTATMRLLFECARFNRLLLKGIFNNDMTGTVTYDSGGSSEFRSDMAFVNLKL